MDERSRTPPCDEPTAPDERTHVGVHPVVPRESEAPSNVLDLLTRRLLGSLVGNVCIVAYDAVPPRGLRITLEFQAAGAFAPVLLALIKEVVIGGRSFFRLPSLDGAWRVENGHYMVEMGILRPKHGNRWPSFASDDVRLVFRR